MGKSEALSAFRRARDSLMRADADAMSGLFFSASEMMRERVGSSKRFHQRERSRVGEATGKWEAFFQSAGREIFCLVKDEGPAQALNPAKARLGRRKNRTAFIENLDTTLIVRTFRKDEGYEVFPIQVESRGSIVP